MHTFSRLHAATIALAGIAAVGALTLTSSAKQTSSRSRRAGTPKVLRFKMKSLAGRMVKLSKYKGKVILMVNTASKCGFTPEYAGLEAIYKKYHKKGLVILGFPENDFLHQEPGTDKQISAFCTSHFGITFPMFSKIHVKGSKQCPLYHFLTGEKTDPKFPGPVLWNFEKFLISRKGKIVARFRSAIRPRSPQVVDAIKKQLAK